MKKISVILIMLMIMNCIVSNSMIFAETESFGDEVSVVFDKKVKTQNITRLIYNPLVAADSAENTPIIELIDGEYALKRVKQTDSGMFLGINIDDSSRCRG